MKHLYPAKALFIVALFFAVLPLANAQPGCPQIDAGSNQTLPCGVNCANLTANYFETGNTNTYGVSQIGYTPFSFTAGTPILVNIDDIWSSAINLPFTFCFFGQSYNQVVVGANGLITFDVSEAGQGCNWSTTGTPNPTLPTTAMYTNCIMGPYHDIDPSLGGQIRYQIIGSAPCRIFVVSYYQVPMYDDIFLVGSCWGTDEATHQIALYETTNAIEVYINRKEACTGWNDGLATLGIQNAAGTVAYTAPGRNNSVWDATNEGWRFTPNGPSIVTVNWFEGGNLIGTGPTVQVCPSTATTYTAEATYLPCSGGTPVVVSDNVTVSLAGTLQVSINSQQNSTCFGSDNGSAIATVTGGSAPVNYAWNDGSTNLTRTNLAPGTYYITATDASNCTRGDTIIITEPPQLIADVPDVSQINCSGTGTGTLVATVTGGTGPYTYAWSGNPAQTDSILDNVQPGTYTVSVTDANNCSITDPGTLTVTAGGNTVALNPATISNVNCFGANNGSITANPTGGSGTYNYNWSNGQTTASIIALSPGAYTVSVDDGAGCTATATYNVTEPTQLTLNAPVIQNVGCSGGNSGTITADAAGGTPNYNYSWSQQSNGQTYTGATIGSLSADTYNLTVYDNFQCSVTASYTVNQVTPLTIAQAQTNVSCAGGADGSASITVNTGTTPYQYNWNGAGPTANATLQGQAAGVVNVTVTDANCSATATFTLTEPTALVITLVNQTDVTCNGGNNGSLAVLATGGTPGVTGYTYAWDNSTTGANATALTAGNYTVTATDGNGCTAAQTYTITQPAALAEGQPVIQNIGCSGGTTGSITANFTGGVGSYNYNWNQVSNGQTYTGQTIGNLAPDTYQLTVTDANNCSITASYQVVAFTPLTFTQSQTEVSCNGGNDGTATITVVTGTQPYQYNWNGTGPTANATIQGLSAGTVNVTITDVNCSATASFVITQPTALTISLANQTNVNCYNGADGTLSVTPAGGTPGTSGTDYFYSWSNGQTNATATALAAGAYIVTVTDGNNCAATATYTITEPTAVSLSATATDATCYNAPNGSISTTAGGGTPPYTYLWSDGQTTDRAIGLVAGAYTCTVSDANNCTAAAQAAIAEPADMVPLLSANGVLCIGDENGTIQVRTTGGTPPYNYSATQDFANFVFATNDTIRNLAAGWYVVIVSDYNGCSKTDSIEVPEATPDGFITSTDSTSCYGADYADGAAHIIATSIQNGPFMYAIDGGIAQYSGDFFFLSAGEHIITATNGNGCQTEIPVEVFEPLPITVQVTPDSLLLPLGESGTVMVTYQNAGNVQYLWSPAEGFSCIDCPNPTVNVYQRGDYVVTVSTTNGTSTCYGTANLHVDVLPELPVYIPNTFSPNGDGNNDVFEIYGQGIRTLDLRIFNRWGELVFETTNQFNGWDGTYKGQLQNPAVFSYYVNITFLNNKKLERKGTVTIIR